MYISPKELKGMSPANIQFNEYYQDFTAPVSDPSILPKVCKDPNNFRQIGEDWEAVAIDMVANSRNLVIRDFKAVTQGKGFGSFALELITEMADRAGARLSLMACPDLKVSENGEIYPEIPYEKLIAFYERHKFFRDPTVYTDTPVMIRPPQRTWSP